MKKAWLILITTGLLASCQQEPPAETSENSEEESVVRYGVRVESGPMDSVLLKDYKPESSLVVPETNIQKAAYPVIDVHTHSNADTPEEVDQWVQTMDATGIQVTVILTGATGQRFDELAELYLSRYPDRFQLFCGIDTTDINASDYSQRAVAELERCYKNGARGVGEVSDKGWGIGGDRDDPLPRDQRLHPDDPRLDPFWEKCAQLEIPVNLHIADHPSCWEPLGPHWERTPDFQGFNLYGLDVPSHGELLAKRDAFLEKHPDTTVIACHLSNQGHDLASLGKVLDRYPNLYLDISARDYELGRQPRSAARFMEQYQDRLVFGTDMGREEHMYKGWWRLLESPDEFIPGRLWWRLYGLDLPDEVLERLYQDNARRILNWEATS